MSHPLFRFKINQGWKRSRHSLWHVKSRTIMDRHKISNGGRVLILCSIINESCPSNYDEYHWLDMWFNRKAFLLKSNTIPACWNPLQKSKYRERKFHPKPIFQYCFMATTSHIIRSGRMMNVFSCPKTICIRNVTTNRPAIPN